MNRTGRISLIVATGIAVVATVAVRQYSPADATSTTAPAASPATENAALPTLVEIGSTTCIPCKEMAPILRQLEADFAGSLRVESIDVAKTPELADPFGVSTIPTQIFLDAGGMEIFRHQGFMARRDILGKWQALGVKLRPARELSEPPAPSRIASLLATMTHAMSASPAIAIAAAALWGVLSILLSPCHMASLPLIVGYIAGQGRITTARAIAIASAFAGGTLASVVIVGLVTAWAGSILGDTGPAGSYIAAGVLLLVALHLLGAVPNPFSPHGQAAVKSKGLAAAALMGLVFGIILGPCTFAFLAPILVVTFRLASGSLAYGAVLMLAYAAGYAAVIILAGSSASLVQRYLNWGEKSRIPAVAKALCGLAMLAGALWLIFSA